MGTAELLVDKLLLTTNSLVVPGPHLNKTTVNDSKEQTGVSTIESSNDIEPGNLELVIQQAFINYNFLYTRFCACKTV